MRIVLIGFMGSGKSTTARLIAHKLGLRLCEMDDLIVRRSGRKSVAEIFDLEGEEQFRALETRVAESLRGEEDVIISCGGGIIKNRENLEHLKESRTLIIYLHASFDEICRRLGEDSERPLFRDLDKARQLYWERAKVYRELGDHVIETDGLSPEEVAIKIIDLACNP